MTKRDLLRFLEPYSDDIQILSEQEMGLAEDLVPRYIMHGSSQSTDDILDVNLPVHIERGEGFVLL